MTRTRENIARITDIFKEGSWSLCRLIVDGNTKNYRTTNFMGEFTEMETLHTVCTPCIDSQTERTAP